MSCKLHKYDVYKRLNARWYENLKEIDNIMIDWERFSVRFEKNEGDILQSFYI